MRGKDEVKVSEEVWFRITPAYAGKSDNQPVAPSLPEDHPRVCGEKKLFETENDAVAGSPPRMRGKADCWSFSSDSKGITPAYAGKSGLLVIFIGQ